MALKVAIANRKGGVGKTTLAIALAETFVFEHKRSTLIVDLDPQSSASEILLSPVEYADRVEKRLVLPRLWSRQKASEKSISNVVAHARHSLIGRGNVDLAIAANSTELWDVELDQVRYGKESQYSEAVTNTIAALEGEFDVVIFDCPPGKTIASEVAILNADIVLCPIVPERLSVWGMDRMKEYFSSLEEAGHRVPPWKFVISKFTGSRSEARRQVEHIRAEYKDHFLTEKLGLLGMGEREFVGLDQAEVLVKRIAKFREDPDDIKNLEQFYGPAVTKQLRLMARHVEKARP